MKSHAAEQESFVRDREKPEKSERAVLLKGLQREIVRLEGRLSEKTRLDLPQRFRGESRTGGFDFEENIPFTFGSQKLDRFLLDGTQKFSGLFEAFGRESREAGILTGFAQGLLAAFLTRADGDVLWVQDRGFTREAGALYGPGLAQFGLDPARLLTVSADRAEEALWAMEEGLATEGIAAVTGAFSAHLKADLTATRRLSLRAHRQKKPALLLRLGGSPPPTAAMTRARITPAPSAVTDGYEKGVGRPVFRIFFDRAKGHSPTDFLLEWRHEDIRFTPAATHSLALAAAPSDRPARPQKTGTVLAPAAFGGNTDRFKKAS